MIQPGATNLRSVHRPFIAAIDLVKLPSRRHHVYIDWKIRAGQLRFQHLTKAVRTEIFRLETVKVKAVLALEKRIEERNALYVVPVIMRHQNVCFDAVDAV